MAEQGQYEAPTEGPRNSTDTLVSEVNVHWKGHVTLKQASAKSKGQHGVEQGKVNDNTC